MSCRMLSKDDGSLARKQNAGPQRSSRGLSPKSPPVYVCVYIYRYVYYTYM